MEFWEIQDWVVAPRRLQAPGVAGLVPFGGLVKQDQIEVDPYKLEKNGLSMAQIAEAVDGNNRKAGGLVLDNREQALVIRGIGLVEPVEKSGPMRVKSIGGVPILIRDMGQVTVGATPRTGNFGFHRSPGGVEGIVLMRRGENPSEVLARVKETVAEMNQTALPVGREVVAFHDRTELVSNTLRAVGRTLTEALVVVVAPRLFTLGSLQAAVLTAVRIP